MGWGAGEGIGGVAGYACSTLVSHISESGGEGGKTNSWERNPYQLSSPLLPRPLSESLGSNPHRKREFHSFANVRLTVVAFRYLFSVGDLSRLLNATRVSLCRVARSRKIASGVEELGRESCYRIPLAR